MPEKLSKEQRHERFWCAFTHVRIAWVFVAFCALEAFTNWRELDKPISRPSLPELPFYILLLVVYAPIFLMIFRCFRERFVIGIGTAQTAMAVVSWFAPTLFSPLAYLIRWAFLVLWVLAFVLSLNMPVQAARNPYIAGEGAESLKPTKSWLIMGSVILILMVLGALLYFVPSP